MFFHHQFHQNWLDIITNQHFHSIFPMLDLLINSIRYVVRPNDVWKVDGKGMPRTRGSGFGDLIIEFDVEFPEKLPKSALDHLKKTLAEHVPSSRSVTEVPEGQQKVFTRMSKIMFFIFVEMSNINAKA